MKKKLIEVALPLEAINKASAREKSIRHGHPSTLHLWWARRPLAACRAVLFAQLVDDPSSHPDRFPTEEAVSQERQRLFKLIEELVLWENSTNEPLLARAREEIRNSCGGELPPVYDPFSGGCSIPLEAQRLGLPAYGSDLNPVAVTIGKAMIEIPPRFRDQAPIHPAPKARTDYRHAEGLAEDVKHYGEWMRERALEKIGNLYPSVTLPKENGGGEGTVIAWIWARTVPSPDPAFSDTHVPIASSFALSTKKGKETIIEPMVDRAEKRIQYRIKTEVSKAELEQAKTGTKAGRGANFICLLSGSAITPQHVKSMGKAGQMGQELIAIVAEGKKGRIYCPPQESHIAAAQRAVPSWKPATHLPNDPRNFWTIDYGLETFGDLFTNRQLVALNTFSELVGEARQQIEADALKAGLSDDPTPLRDGGTGAKAYSEGVSVYLGFAISKITNLGSSITSWMSDRGALREIFARQAIPMVWDYAEVNFFSNSGGNWSTPIEKISKSIASLPEKQSYSQVIQSGAAEAELPTNTVISTDPPYYDNIGYADLSDFFFCWLKPSLKKVYPDLFGLLATPKNEELVATPYRHGGKDNAETFFLNGMIHAMSNMANQCHSFIPSTIYYAFKQSEIKAEGVSSTGWATFLQAVIDAGFSVVGTWPVRTESPGRIIATGTNALANSVVLVCRKKSSDAEMITRSDFVRRLKRELPAAIEKLQEANIAPADMPQSAIGPGMGIFSRYAAVLENDDSPMSVKTALQLINRELDEYLSDVQGELDDETRFALSWYTQFGYDKGDYGTANSLAQARGIAVEAVAHAGIITAEAGKVALIPREQMPSDWRPDTDDHLTLWECCQHLIRTLEDDGESAAAELLARMAPTQSDEIKDLAYCLYDIAANKRGEAKEGTSYNGLIAVWSDLQEMARQVDISRPVEQKGLDF